jgi:4-hydroxy-tetrahydrodipicolinate reductase
MLGDDQPNHSARASTAPRVLLYGAGRYGQEFARLASARGWPIVAAVNRAGPKVGRDLGQLAGLAEPLGIVVEDCETYGYAATEADVAVVFVADRLRQNFPAYQRLLSAGLDVVCHGTESYYPWGSDAETATRINELAVEHGATFTGTGIWDTSRIWSGILAAGQCASLVSLHHTSITQINYPSPRLAEYVGLDMTPGEFTVTFEERRHALAGMYKTIPEHVMVALGLTVTDVIETLEPVVYTDPVASLSLNRDIPAGHTTGIRIRVDARSAEGITATANIELRILRPGETEHMEWNVDGAPRSRIVVERQDSRVASAAVVLNRLPHVIAAPPGIRLLSELGPLATNYRRADEAVLR